MYVYRPPFILLLLYCYQIDSSLNTFDDISLDRFIILDGFTERNVYNLVVFNANHDISLIFHNSVDSGCA